MKLMNLKIKLNKIKSSFLLILLSMFLTSFTNVTELNFEQKFLETSSLNSTLLSESSLTPAISGVKIDIYHLKVSSFEQGNFIKTIYRNDINFNWSSNFIFSDTEGQTIGHDNIFIRLSGYIVAKYDRPYFRVFSDDGARMRIADGPEGPFDNFYNDWVLKGQGGIIARPLSMPINSVKYFEIEYFEHTGGANIVLQWHSSNSASSMQTVDASYFSLTPPTRTINFVTNNQTTINPLTFPFNTTPELPSPSKPGNTFGGWYKESNFNNLFSFANHTYDANGSTTIHAKWNLINYSIVLDKQSGIGGSSTTTANYNMPMLSGLTAPTRIGHKFLGYFDQVSGGKQYYSPTMTSSNDWDKLQDNGNPIDFNLYARWQVESYNISYNLNYSASPSPPPSTTAVFNGSFVVPVNPSRFGYQFLGWSETSAGNTNFDFSQTVPDLGADLSTKTFFARWNANNNKIVFNGNGATSGTMADQNILTDVTAQLNNNGFFRTGYTFAGWSTTSDGAVVYANAGNYPMGTSPTNDLFARWNANPYKVELVISENSKQEVYFLYDQNYNLPLTEKTGYSFDGWFTQLNGGNLVTNLNIVLIDDNHSLYARFTPNVYTITYENDGLGSSHTSQEVTYDSSYNGLATISRSGFDFLGWFTHRVGGVKISNGDKVDILENTILYPRWSIRTFDVTFNPNNGTLLSSSIKTVEYNSLYGTLAEVKRDGYSFLGWSTELNTQDFKIASDQFDIDGNQTLYATWSPIEYTLTFNKNSINSSEPSFSSKQILFDDNYNSLPNISRTGYSFDGWYTLATGGSLVTQSSVYKNLSNQTLFARWIANKYSVIFDANQGSEPSFFEKMVTYDQTFGEVPTTLREGFVFTGWLSADEKIMPNPNYMVDFTTDQFFKAQWAAIEYSISFVGLKSGEDTMPKTYTVESPEINLSLNLDEPGIKFLGFFDNADFGGPAQAIIPSGSTGDLTLYASYEYLPFKLTFKDDLGEVIVEQTVLFDAEVDISSLGEIIKTGYEFKGWSDNLPAKMPAEDVEVTAKFEIKQFKLLIKNSLGNILIEQMLDFEASLESFAANSPDIDGYTFEGWSSIIPEKMPENDLEIIANFKKIPIFKFVVLGARDEIIYEFNLRESEMIPEVILPDLSGRSDFEFTGWDSNIPTNMPSYDITIKPLGSKKMNTISFYTTDKTYITSIEDQIGVAINAPKLTRIGYTFSGWENDVGAKFELNSMPSNSMNFFSSWQPNVYLIDVTVGPNDFKIEIIYGQRIGNIPSPQLFGYRFEGWKNDITGDFVNSDTIFENPDEIKLVPILTRLNATETLVAATGSLLKFVFSLFR